MHIGSRVPGLMNSDFRNIEFRNILAQAGPAIQPGDSGSRPGEHAFGRSEDHHYSINALQQQQQQHRESKPVQSINRENEFASRIQSLMSGDVALGNLQQDHHGGGGGAGPSSVVQQLMSSSPMMHHPNGGGGGVMGPGSGGGGGAMQVGGIDAQNDQSSSRAPSRYEAQKRRDWNTFGQYLRNHRPPLALARCTGQHVLEFVRYLDQFGKTKVHTPNCPFFGLPHPPHPCPCPLRQAWGSLDALIGRLRAAFEENGGKPESNPFGARQVRLYLREVREMQAKARGIAYEKKKRKRMPSTPGDAPGGPNVNMNLSNGIQSNGNVHALPAQQ